MMNRIDAESLVAALRAFIRVEIASSRTETTALDDEDRQRIEANLVQTIMRLPPLESR